jgi:penicillin amidase
VAKFSVLMHVQPPSKRPFRRLSVALAALVAILLVLGLDFVVSFRRSVPSYDGAVKAEGLIHPVQILRDGHAVPHILAQSFEDAAFGLGYAHAQDRLWQMELSRRFIQGRLAEMLGGLALEADILLRTMGLYPAARQALEHLSPDTRRVLDSYSAGVNSYISGHRERWPIEFVLAGVSPEPWTPTDSIAVLKGMAFELSGNAFGEAARARLLPVLGLRGIQDFFLPFDAAPLPRYLDDAFLTTRTGSVRGVPSTTASDNWVVSGEHSVSGKPLLANDPHLGFTIPSFWYLAHLSFAGEDIVGGTLPGIPSIVVGRNRSVAWGVTNTGPDTQDLYLERLNTDNPRQYQTPAGLAEFATRTEVVRVRFGGERRIVVRESRHGPIVSDAPSAFEDATPDGYELALAWTALDPDDTSMEALLALGRAKNAADIRSAGRLFVTPMQNIVYADAEGTSGHIGLMLPGRVPIRAESNDSLGLVPAPGWDGRYDWRDPIPADAMVSIVDPASGRIATANNRSAPDGYPYVLTREWESNFRYDRIEQLLSGQAKHSLDSFKSIQTDPIDLYALDMKTRLLAAGTFEGRAGEAARLVGDWNGAMLRDRPEPLIFSAWVRALARRIYGDELGVNFASFWGYREQFIRRVLDNVEDAGRWCDDKGTPDIEDCASRIRLALADAATELSEIYGQDISAWRWGDAHKAVHIHRPLGNFPLVGSYFNREIEMDGGAFTLLRAANAMSSNRPYTAVHGAGYRAIYDLGAPDQSLYMISVGQSGNIYSPHYDDLLGLWAETQYITIPTAPEAVRATAGHTLVLHPVAAPAATAR